MSFSGALLLYGISPEVFEKDEDREWENREWIIEISERRE